MDKNIFTFTHMGLWAHVVYSDALILVFVFLIIPDTKMSKVTVSA